MKLTTQIEDRTCIIDLDAGICVAIDLEFDGEQPQHFGANAATRNPMQAGDFIGRTSRGGSCNVDVMTINPHCNGTHTETVSHIVNDEITIGSAAMQGLYLAHLITVKPQVASNVSDDYDPPMQPSDVVISRQQIQEKLRSFDFHEAAIEALLVRTLPNSLGKRTAKHGDPTLPAFFTADAMDLIVESGIRHLLVDLPSVDAMHDDGKLTNHHLFWNVDPGAKKLSDVSWTDKTITEMIYVPDNLADGLYVLNLQLAAFNSDVCPSRPILYPTNQG